MDLMEMAKNLVQPTVNNDVKVLRDKNGALKAMAGASSGNYLVPDTGAMDIGSMIMRILGVSGQGNKNEALNQAYQRYQGGQASPQDLSSLDKEGMNQVLNMAQMAGGVKSTSPLEALYKTAGEYAKNIPVNQLNLNTPDFQTAMGDVLQGKKSFTPGMPSLVKSGVIKDGNTRIADQIQKGATSVKAITDENIYNNLMDQVSKFLDRPRDALGRFKAR